MTLGRLRVTSRGFPWQFVTPHWSRDTKQGERWGFGRAKGMGRFGGGWDYKLGVMIGGRSVILSLLFGELRFEIIKREGRTE